MNLGSNFNNQKLFTGELRSKTSSVDMNRYNDRFGIRSADEVRMARMKLRDQLNKKNSPSVAQPVMYKNPSTNTEQHYNHIEAVRNIKRGL